jgi:hypothetical protein
MGGHPIREALVVQIDRTTAAVGDAVQVLQSLAADVAHVT